MGLMDRSSAAPDSSHLRPQEGPRRLFRPRAAVVAVVVAASVAAALGAGAVWVYLRVNEAVADCYAQWRVADIVIQYLEWHGGSWPKDWDDLEEAREACVGRSWPAEELRLRVEIDFAAEPKALAAAEPPIRAIRLTTGKRHHWDGAEPNELVRAYLRERARRPPGYKYPKRPDPREKEARSALVALGGSWKLGEGGRVTEVSLGPPAGADAALACLRSLPEVRGLNLGDSDASDAGLAGAGGLPRLRWIYLYRTRVTDAGLAHLRDARELETLVLASANFTDAAFEHIAAHPRLKLLNLNGAHVTDAGIARLHGMTSLEEVLLADTGVSPEGVRRLQEALPHCKIYFPTPPGR
jgi:hypothetical protein